MNTPKPRAANTAGTKRAKRERSEAEYRDHRADTAAFWRDFNHRRQRRRANRWLRKIQEDYQ